MAPLVVHSWSHQTVRFPGLTRRLATGYRSLTAERLHAVVAGALGADCLLGTRVRRVQPTEVELDDGRILRARAVIDGRGQRPSPALRLAYQKFLGQEVELAEPHGLDGPVIMDATVDQLDGFRFVYLLPFDERRLLIEDTYYSDTPALDAETVRARLGDYAAAQGWRIARVEREEAGLLPITLAGDLDALWREGEPGLARSGLRAALFHPATGYSLPDAVRLADRLATLEDWSSASVHAATLAHSRECWRLGGFFRLLNRMLFLAAEPAQRWRVIARFYRRPERTIQRFYAGRLTLLDKARILIGRPPVPLLPAFRSMPETPLLQRTTSPA